MIVISESPVTNVKEKLPQIINRIFDICKYDNNFQLKEKLMVTEDEIKVLSDKLKNKEKVIEDALKIKSDLQKRLSELENKNFDLKSKSLESLGSEL